MSSALYDNPTAPCKKKSLLISGNIYHKRDIGQTTEAVDQIPKDKAYVLTVMVVAA